MSCFPSVGFGDVMPKAAQKPRRITDVRSLSSCCAGLWAPTGLTSIMFLPLEVVARSMTQGVEER